MATVNVFVSYARPGDSAHCKSCVNALRLPDQLTADLDPKDLYLDTFVDWERLGAGDRFPAKLSEALAKAHIGIILFSHEYLRDIDDPAGRWRRQEAQTLIQRNVPVFPVVLERCEWWLAFPELKETLAFPGKHEEMPRDPQAAERGWWVFGTKVREVAVEVASTLAGGSGSDARHDAERPYGEARPFIAAAVRSGRLLPILGPDCHAARHNRQRAVEHVSRRRRKLHSRLDRTGQDYLDSIIRANFQVELSDEDDRRSIWKSQPRHSLEDAALKCIESVAATGVAAVTFFGRAMAIRAPGLTDVSRYALELDTTAEETRSMVAELEHAASIMKGVSRDRGDAANAVGLGPLGISEGLENLADRFRGRGRPMLSLLELEWLGDLLWHLIRFDAPMYPTADELAFQLAMCSAERKADERVTGRASVGIVALRAVRDEDYFESIRAWFRPATGDGRLGGSEPNLYQSVVEAICRRAPVAERERCSPTELATASQGGIESGQFVPIAISCNFDMELENELKRPHHVVFPVWYSIDTGHGRSKSKGAAWILRTRTGAGTLPGYEDRLLRSDADPDALSKHVGKYIGPLIVKLYGSPLEELLPLQLTSLGGTVLMDHRLVLSDYSILLDALQGGRLLPPGLEKLLGTKPARMFCFLGFPLRDPISRLRIVQHATQREADWLSREVAVVDHPGEKLLEPFSKRLGAAVYYCTESLDQIAAFMASQGQGPDSGAGTQTGGSEHVA